LGLQDLRPLYLGADEHEEKTQLRGFGLRFLAFSLRNINHPYNAEASSHGPTEARAAKISMPRREIEKPSVARK
jgi:hypothetical protein